MTREIGLKEYFEEAASWDTDRLARAENSARWARRVAALFAVIAVSSLGAVVALVPLKTVEPFVIRVDNSTGVVDVVPAYTGGASPGEVVSRYLLTHYVTTCERFALAVAEQDYSECGAFHNAARNQQWAAQWAIGNPESPLNRFRDGTTVRAEVHSVSFFGRADGARDLAQVRFSRELRPGGSGTPQTTRWIATVQFAYGRPPNDPATRRWNPLGFRILDYRLEPEVASSSRSEARS
jgi:type IV secretion system protein VirB8